MDGIRNWTLGLAIAAATLATGAPALAAGAEVTFVERATTDAISVHGGAAADNVGDILTFANEVFDAANAVKVGSDQGYCVRVVVGKSWECFWTLILAEGQITVEGPFLDTGDSVMVVTGGTGKYAGAKGDMKLHSRDAKSTAYDFTYELL